MIKNDKGRQTYNVPGASAIGVRALVAGELVDENTNVAVVVMRALAARGSAARRR
jgi:hypothetical protein